MPVPSASPISPLLLPRYGQRFAEQPTRPEDHQNRHEHKNHQQAELTHKLKSKALDQAYKEGRRKAPDILPVPPMRTTSIELTKMFVPIAAVAERTGTMKPPASAAKDRSRQPW